MKYTKPKYEEFKIGDTVTFSDSYKRTGERQIGFANPIFRVVNFREEHRYGAPSNTLVGVKLINRDVADVKSGNWRDWLRKPNGMNFNRHDLKLVNTCKLRQKREMGEK